MNRRIRKLHAAAQSEFSKVRFKGDDDRAGAVYEGTEPLRPADIAEVVFFAATLPPHVNVNTLEVMSIDQSWGHLAVHREKG
jgi:NADP-dependent 3-hydroxy acid dehydrogenase YdfG